MSPRTYRPNPPRSLPNKAKSPARSPSQSSSPPPPPRQLGELPAQPPRKQLTYLKQTRATAISSSEQTIDPIRRQRIAEQILGPVDWESQTRGHFPCPGASRHTSNSTTDATVFLNFVVPTVKCYHKSCAREVDKLNRRLRSRISRAEAINQPHYQPQTPRIVQQPVQVAEQNRTVDRWRQTFLAAIASPIDPRQLYRESPTALPFRIDDDRCLFLQLFTPADRIWIGDLTDTGEWSFKPISDLIKSSKLRGPFICPATFKDSATRRQQTEVLHRRFLVVESDELSTRQHAALLMALSKEWSLAAIVSTGGKSLHGWFRWVPDWETKAGLLALKARLEIMKCDVASITSSQPFRLPGVLNQTTLRYQALIYLDLAHSYNAI